MSSRNTIKVKIKDSGSVELKLQRRDTYGTIRETVTFSLPRRTLERALAEATLEAPPEGKEWGFQAPRLPYS